MESIVEKLRPYVDEQAAGDCLALAKELLPSAGDRQARGGTAEELRPSEDAGQANDGIVTEVDQDF